MRRRVEKLSEVSKEEKKRIIQERKKSRKALNIALQVADNFLESDSLSKKQKEGIENYKRSIKDTLKESYSKKGKYSISTAELEKRANFAKELSNNSFDTDVMRKNKIFQRDINQATVGGVSTKSKAEAKIFYSATKEIWNGLPISERNQALLDYFNVETISEAWDIVMQDENVKKALEQAKKNQQKASSDSDVSDGSNDVPDEIGSPDYIKYLVLSNDTVKKYAKN